MLFQELIRAKRDGQTLTSAQMEQLVRSMTNGGASDEQLGAFAMAVYWRGMSEAETVALTLAMRDSGRVMTWHNRLPGPVVDKHSTGGVGDATSLLVGPWVAACGAFVPMISGRGLGHTGGTLDKLAALPGYDCFPDPERFQRIVADVGVAIIGQTDDLAPADRRLYAIRDVTATVDSIPLIVASILAKKLAEGLDGLVLDVKNGSGAVMTDEHQAQILGEALVAVSSQAGTPATALLTDMDQPLGCNAGNALEIAEILDLLTGERSGGRLFTLSRCLAAHMLQRAGLADNEASALDQLDRAWQRGEVAERFGRMVGELGGPGDVLTRYRHYLPQAPVVRAVHPNQPGRVQSMDMRAVGLAVVELGGGRRRASDRIDSSVGLSALASPGQHVDGDRPLAIIHARSESDAEAAAQELRAAVTIGDTEPLARPLIARVFSSASTGA